MIVIPMVAQMKPKMSDDNNTPMCQARPVATEVHFQHKVKKSTTHIFHVWNTYIQ